MYNKDIIRMYNKNIKCTKTLKIYIYSNRIWIQIYEHHMIDNLKRILYVFDDENIKCIRFIS